MKKISQLFFGITAMIALLGITPSITTAAPSVLVNVRLLNVGPDSIMVRKTDSKGNVDYTFKVTSTTVFKERTGSLLPKAQLGLGDTVNVWVESLTAGSRATKVVDLQTWKTSVTGRISDKDDGRMTFTQAIPSTIKAIDMTVYQQINVETDETTTAFRQTEVKKVVSRNVTRTIRTGKVRAWSDLTEGMNVTVTGYWHRASGMMTALRVQMPDKAI